MGAPGCAIWRVLRVFMGRSRLSWAVGILAPWCLGAGALVSFTASAGQDVSIGASSFGAAHKSALPARLASLTVGDKSDLMLHPDEIEPRRDIKANVQSFPVVDRSRRSDPLVTLRPTLDTQLRKRGGTERPEPR